MMGDDEARGIMTLKKPSEYHRPDSLDRAHHVIDWPKAAQNPALKRADEMLQAKDRKPGFDGGQYVPNPLWRALPADAAGVMSGPPPGGRVLTVHPLGGCPMGETARSGVVDHKGEVFNAAGANPDAVHAGLFVLDGSILPHALGVNPFLTISALAWRAAEMLRARRQWTESPVKRVPASEPPARKVVAKEEPKPVRLQLREQLYGKLDSTPSWLSELLPKAGDPAWSGNPTDRLTLDRGFILRVEMDIP